MLEDRSGRVRAAAAVLLGQERDRTAVPELLRHLDVDTTFVHPSILIALGRIGDATALPRLLIAAETGPNWTRVCAVRALASFPGPETQRVVRAAVTDPAWSIRGAAGYVLGRIGDADDLGRLLALLNDPHPWPRRGALYALGRLELVEAGPRIRDELRSRSAEVSLAAVWALGALRDDGALEGLITLLAGRGRSAPVPTEGEGLTSDAPGRLFDALVQSIGRILATRLDPASVRALLEARARVHEDEWEVPARLPAPEIEGARSVPTVRELFDVALAAAAEEGEL
jgi:HEAT repeat protein